jgi:hypothetical protein
MLLVLFKTIIRRPYSTSVARSNIPTLKIMKHEKQKNQTGGLKT